VAFSPSQNEDGRNSNTIGNQFQHARFHVHEPPILARSRYPTISESLKSDSKEFDRVLVGCGCCMIRVLSQDKGIET